MCALFGSGVSVRQVATGFADVKVQRGPLLDPPAIQAAELIATGTNRFDFEAVPVTSHPVDEGLITAHSQIEAILPVRAASHDFGTLKLASRVHTVAEGMSVRVHKGLATVRELPVLKRMVPIRAMSDEQVGYWKQRLGNAKRVSPRQISLVGVFPDVPLQGDQPVQFRAEEGAIAFHLPDRPVPLSTVVVAKHTVTGEVLIGRFHSDVTSPRKADVE